MKETFIPKQFSVATMAVINIVNTILGEYAGMGYDLSLRQLYYQMVSRDYIENSVKSYKRFGVIVSDARLAGLVDWNMIRDRGRNVITPSHWDSPKDILESAAHSFAIDKWANQPSHIEVMVEKDALSGVLEPVCREHDISFTANKGYSSSSTMYESGKRMLRKAREGKDIYILYLGDHDPSGIDMTRDVRERIELFSGRQIEVQRLALNMNQIDDLQPPENPAKEVDPRFKAYMLEFGDKSWELDAIEPRSLVTIVEDAIFSIRDADLWEDSVRKENKLKDELQRMADNYQDSSD